MSGLRNPQRLEGASRWFAARRRGVMTLDERAAYAEWLRDSANADAMAELERVWAVAGIAAPHIPRETAEDGVPRQSAVVRSALVAAMCAVSIGIAVLSYNGTPAFWTTLDWADR